ncbi:hypothetical protein J6590_020521, partial [Homalodisca vitripennis]
FLHQGVRQVEPMPPPSTSWLMAVGNIPSVPAVASTAAGNAATDWHLHFLSSPPHLPANPAWPPSLPPVGVL